MGPRLVSAGPLYEGGTMVAPGADFVEVKLSLSRGLYRQVVLIARNAGKDIEPTIKNLLWIAVGQINLKASRGNRDR